MIDRIEKTGRLVSVVAVVLVFSMSAALAAGASAAPRVVAGRYIVKLRTANPQSAANVERMRGVRVGFVYQHALAGFSAELSSVEVARLRQEPSVAAVIPDEVVRAADVQVNPDWGLDRIDQRYLPLDGAYSYRSIANGVIVYVIDSGITVGNPDFGARRVSGVDEVGDGLSPPTDDCNGHGTHVAGTIGGSAYGVAKAVTLVAVRILGCDGLGTTSALLAGIDWIDANHRVGQPAVANLSIGYPARVPVIDRAIETSIGHGIVYAVAAGNGTNDDGVATDACSMSPADIGGANGSGELTVAASDRTDTRADFSNFGSCVDVFAPGVDITSDWLCGFGTCGTNTVSGTSTATPHVAGVAALYLAQHPMATPAQVKRAIVANATRNVIHDPHGSPNLLVWDFATTPAPPPPRVSAAGYWMLGAAGAIYPFGDARSFGDALGFQAAITARHDGSGYWIVDASGNVEPFGNARTFGGRPARHAGERITSISATPDGGGYWLFTNLGRAFAYGDAHFYGDMRNVALNGPVIASAATASGHGYYMVATDGGVFSFGDARFHGSTGGMHLNRPVVGIATPPSGTGYWLVASDGGVFAFDAPFRGSMGGRSLSQPVDGMIAHGNGYLLVASDGGVFDFSNKPFSGSLGGQRLPAPVIGIAAFAT